jgi:hypothetical protein
MQTELVPTARITKDIAHVTMAPPTERFSVGDKIKVYGSTRHYGRTATILKVGRKRLTVNFHDNAGGHYVNHGNAHLINTPPARDPPVLPSITARTSLTIDDNTTMTEGRSNNTTMTEGRSIGELSAVLEQLAVTTATAIKMYGRGERDLLFHAFVRSLDNHLGGDDEDSPIQMGFFTAEEATTTAGLIGTPKETEDDSSKKSNLKV